MDELEILKHLYPDETRILQKKLALEYGSEIIQEEMLFSELWKYHMLRTSGENVRVVATEFVREKK